MARCGRLLFTFSASLLRRHQHRHIPLSVCAASKRRCQTLRKSMTRTDPYPFRAPRFCRVRLKVSGGRAKRSSVSRSERRIGQSSDSVTGEAAAGRRPAIRSAGVPPAAATPAIAGWEFRGSAPVTERAAAGTAAIRPGPVFLTVKNQKALDQLRVCLVRADGLMMKAHDLPDLIEQSRPGSDHQSELGLCHRVCHFQYPLILKLNRSCNGRKEN